MAYKGTFMLDDNQMYHVFKKCKELGALAMVHAENGDVIHEVGGCHVNSSVTVESSTMSPFDN